jgi:hypothetical protein
MREVVSIPPLAAKPLAEVLLAKFGDNVHSTILCVAKIIAAKSAIPEQLG